MAKEIQPVADYKVKVVGPSKSWSFDGDKGKVEMATDSIQFEGFEQYWVDVNRQASADAPKEGETLNGSIEQDDAGKYPPKFKKSKKGGGGWGGGGGGRTTPGAIWSSAVETASSVVAGYYAASGTKPKNMAEYLSKIEVIAPKINSLVDKLAGANKPAETEKSESESGESAGAPAAAPAAAAPAKADVVIEDISDEDLGDW